MTKSELTEKTVAELKVLAKKMKVSLSSSAKKDEIVTALLASGPKSESGRKPAKKPVVKETIAATKRVVKKAAAATKQALTKAVRPKKAAAAKPAVEEPETKVKIAAVPRRTATKGPVKTGLPVREWRLPPVVQEPQMVQDRVSEAKYYTGPATHELTSAHGDLPVGYGEDKVVLMMRDPFVAHAYWEVTPARIERERSWFGWGSKLCIRIYDITGVQFDGRNAIGYFDQEVSDRTGNWYFDLGRPSHSFCAELGLLAPEGRFLTLVRSNYITMPIDTASDVIDEEWMLVDEEFWKLYGLPSGLSSPHMHMQEMARRRRLLEITSPGLFSRERQKRKQKQKS